MTFFFDAASDGGVSGPWRWDRAPSEHRKYGKFSSLLGHGYLETTPSLPPRCPASVGTPQCGWGLSLYLIKTKNRPRELTRIFFFGLRPTVDHSTSLDDCWLRRGTTSCVVRRCTHVQRYQAVNISPCLQRSDVSGGSLELSVSYHSPTILFGASSLLFLMKSAQKVLLMVSRQCTGKFSSGAAPLDPAVVTKVAVDVCNCIVVASSHFTQQNPVSFILPTYSPYPVITDF